MESHGIEPRDVLAFWFGDGTNERYSSAWFTAPNSAARRRIDGTVDARFGALVRRAARGDCDAWLTAGGAFSPRGALALIVVLD